MSLYDGANTRVIESTEVFAESFLKQKSAFERKSVKVKHKKTNVMVSESITKDW